MRIIIFLIIFSFLSCEIDNTITEKVFYFDMLNNNFNLIEEKVIDYNKINKGNFEYDGKALIKIGTDTYKFGQNLTCNMKSGNNIHYKKNVVIGCYYCNDPKLKDEESFSFISDDIGLIMIKGLENYIFYDQENNEELQEFIYYNLDSFDLKITPLPPPIVNDN